MDEFNLGEGSGKERDAAAVAVIAPPVAGQYQSLEKTVSQTKIDLETARQSELEEIRRKQIELIKKAEDVEKKYSGSTESIAILWDRAVRDIIKIYNPKAESDNIKVKTYDLLKMCGLDLYKRDANKILSSVQSKADKIKEKLDYLQGRLEKNVGEKGIAVKLKKEKEIATCTANALVLSKKAEKEYTTEIAQKEIELVNLDREAKTNTNADYSVDREYIKTKIGEIEKERIGVQEDIIKLSNKAHLYRAKIKAKEAIVNSINIVYTKGTRIYTDLQSQIEIAREFINNGKIMDEGLGKTVADLEEAITMTETLTDIETRLGETLVDGTKIIKDKMAGVQKKSEEKKYLTDLKKESNEDKQILDLNVDEFLAEYATVPYS